MLNTYTYIITIPLRNHRAYKYSNTQKNFNDVTLRCDINISFFFIRGIILLDLKKNQLFDWIRMN